MADRHVRSDRFVQPPRGRGQAPQLLARPRGAVRSLTLPPPTAKGGRGGAGRATNLGVAVDPDHLVAVRARPPLEAVTGSLELHPGAAFVADLTPQGRERAAGGRHADAHRRLPSGPGTPSSLGSEPGPVSAWRAGPVGPVWAGRSSAQTNAAWRPRPADAGGSRWVLAASSGTLPGCWRTFASFPSQPEARIGPALDELRAPEGGGRGIVMSPRGSASRWPARPAGSAAGRPAARPGTAPSIGPGPTRSPARPRIPPAHGPAPRGRPATAPPAASPAAAAPPARSRGSRPAARPRWPAGPLGPPAPGGPAVAPAGARPAPRPAHTCPRSTARRS